MRIPTSFAIMMMVSSFAWADQSHPYRIEAVRVSDITGLTYLVPTEPVIKVNIDCQYVDMLAMDKDAPQYQSMYSAMLAAGSASKSVTVWVSDASADCLNERQRITAVQVNF
ncbi:hypothetical protein [Vibrio owensii]|uniref:hypothetical protein n=1 Tax=Vibrio owensii TaxID=696485 RepID=UPI002FF31172